MSRMSYTAALIIGISVVSVLVSAPANASLECSTLAAGSIFDTCISNTISGGSGGGSGKPYYMQSVTLPKL